MCSALVAVALAARAVEIPRADDPDHFTPADKSAMLALARRRLAGKDAPAFDPATMPAKLLRSTGRPLLLSAHWPGREPLIAVAASGSLFEQLAEAGRRLRQQATAAVLGAARLKLDLVASSAKLDVAAGTPLVLGIEGICLRDAGGERFLPPSEALRLNLASGEAFVRHALGRLKAPAGGLRDVAIERFSTASFIERGPGGAGGPPVDLVRGMPLVERFTRADLLAACEAAGDYLLRVQKPDGTFHYLYDAAKDATDGPARGAAASDPTDSPEYVTRHAGTAWSLAQLYGATGRRRFRDAASRALEWLVGRLRARDDMAWVEQGGEGHLGASALAAVALLEYRAARGTRRHDRAIRQLGRFLVFMQRDDGFFHSHYAPRERRGHIPDGHVPLFAPGEAFLALVRLQRAVPEAAWQRAAAKAADFMAAQRDAWHYEHDLPMIHPDSWTMMALDELHAQGSARRVHADYCLFLAREILEEQETPASARWRDHVGAPRAAIEAPQSAVAAGRAEGLLAAWRLARRMGVAADDYRRAILLSACFQLAHQYGAVNSYLLPNPARAAGGFYASYADHSVRVDYVQHNLSSLLGLAELLGAEGKNASTDCTD
ncbi:MAG TPA: hypothetical protein VNE39_08920 [Planctomycetota bacterium]|nr:hypothetical protein [Planctomycetota bacterium]